jgi:hypothetical protein
VALQSDGTSGYITVGDVAAYLLTGDLTWAARLRVDTVGANDVVVAIEGGTGETEVDNSVFYLQLQGTSGAVDLEYIHENGAGVNSTNRFNTNLSSDTWYNVVVRRDTSANTVEMWINGTAQTTYNYVTDPTSTDTTAIYSLFNRSSGTGAISATSLCEVGLWNRKLTDGEVAILFDGFSPDHIPSGLISYLDLARDVKDAIKLGSPTVSGALTQVDHQRVFRRNRGVTVSVATAGGTTTPVSATATAVGVATVTKQVGKITDADAVGVVATSKQAGKIIGATGVAVSSTVNLTSKIIYEDATGVATVALVEVSTTPVSATATAVGVATTTREVGKITAADATGVVATAKQTGKPIGATAVGVSATTNQTGHSVHADATGVSSDTKQVGKIVGATADGVESVTVAEVSLVTAAATAVGVASVTLLFIAAPAAAPAADTTKAEPLLVNPGQWIKA